MTKPAPSVNRADAHAAEPTIVEPGRVDAAESKASTHEPSLTVKAVLAGLVGITLIGVGANFNDHVLKLNTLVGNHLPVGAFTFILLLTVVWNPLIRHLRTSWCFRTRELAVTLGMMLIASWVPSSSFYRYFQYQLVMPWTEAPSHPEWAKQGTLSYLPAQLYPLHHDPGTATPTRPESRQARTDFDQVYGSFLSGLRSGDAHLPLREAPYWAFVPVMRYWAPMVIAFALCLLSAVWLMHRQWAHNEQLAYPIASVATALIQRAGSRITSDIFYSRLFWIGFVPAIVLHLINYAAVWFPQHVPSIMTEFWCFDLHPLFPTLDHVIDHTVRFQLYFIIIGIAYFIPSEVGLSCGLCTIAVTMVSIQCYLVSGTAPSVDDEQCVQAGAYVAYFAILMFAARHYVIDLLAQALWRRRTTSRHREATWAARLFLLSGAIFVGCLMRFFHLDWFVATLYATMLLIYFLVFARVIAETGIPFMVADWDPGLGLCQVLGLPAIGPTASVVMMYLNGILNPDNRECLTPYVANSLRIAEITGVAKPKLIGVAIAGMLLALVIGFFASTYSLYSSGASNDIYAITRPSFVLDRGTRNLSTLRDSGLFDTSANTHGLGKLALLGSNLGHGRELRWMGFGVVGVLLFAILRNRFLWWPLHPVIFVLWGTWTSGLIWLSFLIGWAVKQVIVRYGGGRRYVLCKPVFIGLIAGEIVAISLQLVVGFIYFFLTDQVPRNVWILPP